MIILMACLNCRRKPYALYIPYHTMDTQNLILKRVTSSPSLNSLNSLNCNLCSIIRRAFFLANSHWLGLLMPKEMQTTNNQLRNDDDLFLPISRLTTLNKHPLYSFPKGWAEFTEYNIKIQRDKNMFNKMLKKFFINSLQDTYVCNRLLCPSCHLRH